MFFGDLKEEGDVRLIDTTAAGLKKILQFFYCSEVELTGENVAEVMHLGHKYDVTECEKACNEVLKVNLKNDNICTTLGLAILYNAMELIELCEQRINANSNAVFKSNNFLECDKRVLAHILRMNKPFCSEVEVFQACMSWVQARSKEDVLTDLLNFFSSKFEVFLHELIHVNRPCLLLYTAP